MRPLDEDLRARLRGLRGRTRYPTRAGRRVGARPQQQAAVRVDWAATTHGLHACDVVLARTGAAGIPAERCVVSQAPGCQLILQIHKSQHSRSPWWPTSPSRSRATMTCSSRMTAWRCAAPSSSTATAWSATSS